MSSGPNVKIPGDDVRVDLQTTVRALGDDELSAEQRATLEAFSERNRATAAIASRAAKKSIDATLARVMPRINAACKRSWVDRHGDVRQVRVAGSLPFFVWKARRRRVVPPRTRCHARRDTRGRRRVRRRVRRAERGPPRPVDDPDDVIRRGRHRRSAK